jgi:CheY-like chemotaxis protein
MEEVKKTVLLVEDEEPLQALIRRKLEDAGLNVLTYVNGIEVMEALKTMEEKPDFIWLDHYLPEMDGKDVLTQLRSNEEWKEIPVMLVTNGPYKKQYGDLVEDEFTQFFTKAEQTLDDLKEVALKTIN